MTEYSALTDAYVRLLLDEAPASEPGSARRFGWMANQFGLYTSRLAAFANTPAVDVRALRNSDLFRAVEIGAAELEREVLSHPAAVQEHWREVSQALRELQMDWSASRMEHLDQLAQTWRRADAVSGERSPAV
jgi:hypothetical protein